MKPDSASKQPLRPYPDIQLRIVFEPSDEGGYTVTVPSLPGCISEGDTLEEARKNIFEAIALYLESDNDSHVSEGGIIEKISFHLKAI